MELIKGKYHSMIGLGFLSEDAEKTTLTPYLKLFIGVTSEQGEKIYLDSKDVFLPVSVEDLNKEFESLIFKIENPDYQDEIAY